MVVEGEDGGELGESPKKFLDYIMSSLGAYT
jgi:hypothetical protein